MKKISILLLALSALLLSACGSTPTGPVFTRLPDVKPGQAQYIFIRTTEYEIKKITHPNIYIDKKNHGEYLYGSYTVAPVIAGDHEISIEGNKFLWDFNDLLVDHEAKAGQRYFFELRLERAGYSTYRASLREVSPQQGLEKLNGLRLAQ